MAHFPVTDPSRSELAYRRIIEGLSIQPQVEALLLGGSRASGTADTTSDYDIYVYVSEPMSVELRRSLLDAWCS